MLVWLGFLQRYRLIASFVEDLGVSHRSGAVATVKEDYPYRIVEIMYKRSWVDEADLESLEEVTLHEVLHVELFGPVERYAKGRGLVLDTEFANLQESAVDLMALWMTRMRADLGDKAWEV